MFFDVIGDTVYEVLHTSSTTDNGHVVDQFSLRTSFEGHRYAEEDKFEYRGREISMQEFEEIAGSIHSVSVEDRILEYWVGEYEFHESVSEPTLMMMNYRMEIYRDNDTYYADIEIDGQTTLARMRATTGLESGKVYFVKKEEPGNLDR